MTPCAEAKALEREPLKLGREMAALSVTSPRSLTRGPAPAENAFRPAARPQSSEGTNQGAIKGASSPGRTELDLPAMPARFLSRTYRSPYAIARPPMLPPFIIDQIRGREEEERRRIERDRPRVELPVDAYRPAPQPQREDDEQDDPDRGVVILDLG